MYFEVFLEIFAAIFALFGIYCLIRLVGATWFGYDNVRAAVEVDSTDTAENINSYLKEAERICLLRGGGRIAVLVRREYCSDKLIRRLKKRKIKYYVIDTEVK